MSESVPAFASPVRVIVAEPGGEGESDGAEVVARALRDAGMEVVYTGGHQAPEQLAEAAVQEDVDAVGLSVLAEAQVPLFARVLEELRKRDAADIVVFGGGNVPESAVPALLALGVARIFPPGASPHEIVDWVRETCAR